MKSKRTGRLVGAPLFVQVIVLMVGALVAAQLLSLLTVFALPPPSPVIYYMSEMVAAYNGQPTGSAHTPLVVEYSDKPPTSTFENELDRGTGRFLQRWFANRVTPQVKMEDVVMHSAASRWFRDVRLQELRQRASENNKPYLTAPFSVGVKQPDGRWKIVRSPTALILDPWTQRALIWFVATTLAIAAAAWIFARRLASPLASFADAAERLGRDPRAPPLDIRGSTEIIVAARAFNDMQQRLRRYVEDRTAMVGAIAHDLRTPLTRLRFRIEGTPEELRAKMSSDLDEMEAMISATLSFVRDATQAGQRTKLELSSLLESLADEMTETGKQAEIERAEKVVVEGDPISLKRLFTNLLENAVKYGGRARIRVFADGPSAVVEIDDDGPGVPAAELERVFEPFYRREPSRSRETGGIGLGLAVVRTIARAHGGDAELQNRPGGGLTARVRLPI
ncbi:ATP-binding protein [soil metagenome]